MGKATEKGLLVGGKEYELDILVFSTGYRQPDGPGPNSFCNATITGRGGLQLSKKWKDKGPSARWGAMTNNFPNMFFTGPMQAGTSASITYMFELMARNAAYLVTEAMRRSDNPDKMTIEPTEEAEEAYANEIVSRMGISAPMAVCLPSYMNHEGARPQGEEALKAARGMGYPLGIVAYGRRLKEWRDEGKLAGMIIS